MSGDVKTDPLLVSMMRRWPTGEVRYFPGNGIGMSGTSTAAFLAEYDQALAEAYRRGHGDGYTLASQDRSVTEPRRAAGEGGE